MRTTIDLPEDLHGLLSAVAHDTQRTLSQTAESLLRRALIPEGASSVELDPRTGLPVISVGRTVTSEDVRSLDDEL
jgi:predicted transcriptional regulator